MTSMDSVSVSLSYSVPASLYALLLPIADLLVYAYLGIQRKLRMPLN